MFLGSFSFLYLKKSISVKNESYAKATLYPIPIKHKAKTWFLLFKNARIVEKLRTKNIKQNSKSDESSKVIKREILIVVDSIEKELIFFGSPRSSCAHEQWIQFLLIALKALKCCAT